MKRSNLLLTILLAGLLLKVSWIKGAFPGEFSDLKIGSPAPDFTLKDSFGVKEYTLIKLKGRIVVIIFGSSTTPNYLESLLTMNELAKRYKGKPVEIFTIYTREMEDQWQPASYFDRKERAGGMNFVLRIAGQTRNFPVLIDTMDEKVFKAYGEVPNATLIINADGTIAYKAESCNPEEVAKELQKLLK